jgi:hypothetical protein
MNAALEKLLISLVSPNDHCIICGSMPDIIGAFIIYAPIEWGGYKGKTRLFRYCLCQRCYAREDKEERVEKILWSNLHRGGVTNG